MGCMARLLIAIIVIYTALALYSLFDCISFESSRVKMMPKAAWAAIIIFLPIVGIVLWYLFGRGGLAQKADAGKAAPAAPDNDPEYLQKISDDLELRRLRELQRQQEEQRRAEKLRGDGPEPRTYSKGDGSRSEDDGPEPDEEAPRSDS